MHASINRNLVMEILYKKIYEDVDLDDNCIIYLHISEAFDKIPHLRLLSKLKTHGIQGKVLRYIKELLSDWMQQDQVNEDKKKKNLATVSSRVP